MVVAKEEPSRSVDFPPNLCSRCPYDSKIQWLLAAPGGIREITPACVDVQIETHPEIRE
jgi:hypothetical protein